LFLDLTIKGFSPHEQLDRAGLLMYVFLKNPPPYLKIKNWFRSFGEKNVTKILVSDNIPYNPEFKFVLVRSVYNVNSFINNKNNRMEEAQVKNIVSLLKRKLRK
jgi:hypothetical protein